MNEKQLIRHWASLINESEESNSRIPKPSDVLDAFKNEHGKVAILENPVYDEFVNYCRDYPDKVNHGKDRYHHYHILELNDFPFDDRWIFGDGQWIPVFSSTEYEDVNDACNFFMFKEGNKLEVSIRLPLSEDKADNEHGTDSSHMNEGEEVDNLLSKAEDGLPVSESEEVNSLMSTAEDGLPVAESEEVDENVDLSQDRANETRNTSDLAYIAFLILQNIVRKVFKLSQTKPSTRFYPRNELHKLLNSMRPGNPKEVKKMDDFLASSGGDEKDTIYLVAAISKSGNVDLNGGISSIVREFKRISGGGINPTFDTIEMNLKDGRYAVLRFLK